MKTRRVLLNYQRLRLTSARFSVCNLDQHIDVIVHEELALVAVVLVTTNIAVGNGTFQLLFILRPCLTLL